MALQNLSEGLIGVRSGAGVITGLALTLTGTTDGPPITTGTTLTVTDGQAKVRFNNKDGKQRLNEGGAVVNAASLTALTAANAFATCADSAVAITPVTTCSGGGNYVVHITSPKGEYTLTVPVATNDTAAAIAAALIVAINADTACPVFAYAGTGARVRLRSKIGGIEGNGYGYYVTVPSTGGVEGTTFTPVGVANTKLLSGGTGGKQRHTVYLAKDGSAVYLDDEGTPATLTGALLMPTITSMKVHSGRLTLGQVDALFDGTNFLFTNIDVSRRESF